MPCTIYLDTTILCALADPPARSGYARTCQQLTRRWWRALPHTRHLCTSEIALANIRNGPAALASARLRKAGPLLILPFDHFNPLRAELFVAGGGLKSDVTRIGSEIACAASHDIELFVTWNWKALEADLVTPLQVLEDNYEAL